VSIVEQVYPKKDRCNGRELNFPHLSEEHVVDQCFRSETELFQQKERLNTTSMPQTAEITGLWANSPMPIAIQTADISTPTINEVLGGRRVCMNLLFGPPSMKRQGASQALKKPARGSGFFPWPASRSAVPGQVQVDPARFQSSGFNQWDDPVITGKQQESPLIWVFLVRPHRRQVRLRTRAEHAGQCGPGP